MAVRGLKSKAPGAENTGELGDQLTKFLTNGGEIEGLLAVSYPNDSEWPPVNLKLIPFALWGRCRDIVEIDVAVLDGGFLEKGFKKK